MDSSIESLELATQNWIYTIKKDDTLSDVEKAENIRKANELLRTIVKERRCEKCQNLCFNLKSCEFCIRKYLENEYSKWSSENDEIDKWILEFQTSFVRTDFILEWIPYNNLQDIQYISEGGSYFKIKAIWAEGRYTSWNFDLHELNRFGPHAVTLKHVNNKNNSDKKQWLQEINAHLSLSKPLSPVVRSYGLTKDDSNNYIIVTENIEKSLKKYLQENLNSLTWVQKYRILLNVLDSLGAVHKNQLIHGDLNSGIIRYSNSREIWLISDFSNCRPVKNPSNKCYGILPYVAPEMLQEQKEQMTQSSDIYSFAMIMWEVSTGYRPFENYQYSPELCVRIVNGSRPEIMRGTPKRYSEIMERCWNGDRSKRPSLEDVQNDIRDILNNYYKSNMSKEEQDEMKRCSNYQMVLIDGLKPYVPKVNQGISSIKIIEFDQISNEIIPEGVGRISYATMLPSTKVAIKTIQINNKSKISLLSKVLQEKVSKQVIIHRLLFKGYY
ncbi:kinase-like domain-containing protein [Glomus cerebriforme]|uniref:Kinase-like domain-containing protein n=1 Tax=Glomus cerebriforme TaxID=658196 RepID=A0A397SSH8_9GLOM|nr:kinase-like domain-containing protein [Glomus cerebriforme]